MLLYSLEMLRTPFLKAIFQIDDVINSAKAYISIDALLNKITLC